MLYKVNLIKSSLYRISSLYGEVSPYSEDFWPFFIKVHHRVKISDFTVWSIHCAAYLMDSIAFNLGFCMILMIVPHLKITLSARVKIVRNFPGYPVQCKALNQTVTGAHYQFHFWNCVSPNGIVMLCTYVWKTLC